MSRTSYHLCKVNRGRPDRRASQSEPPTDLRRHVRNRRISRIVTLTSSLSLSLAGYDPTRRYLKQLDLGVDHSQFDPEDKQEAMQEDRQGLGQSRSQPIIDLGQCAQLIR